MNVRVITPPAIEPVIMQQARDHLRVDHSEDDPVIADMLMAARVYCEAVTWRAFITQTIELYLAGFPRVIQAPRPRLQTVTSIKYMDVDGNEQTVDAGQYEVEAKGEPGSICLKSGNTWPAVQVGHPQPVTVRFVAGYGDTADTVPAPVRAAILIKLTDLYEMRGSIVVGATIAQLDHVVAALLAPYTVRIF